MFHTCEGCSRKVNFTAMRDPGLSLLSSSTQVPLEMQRLIGQQLVNVDQAARNALKLLEELMLQREAEPQKPEGMPAAAEENVCSNIEGRLEVQKLGTAAEGIRDEPHQLRSAAEEPLELLHECKSRVSQSEHTAAGIGSLNDRASALYQRLANLLHPEDRASGAADRAAADGSEVTRWFEEDALLTGDREPASNTVRLVASAVAKRLHSEASAAPGLLSSLERAVCDAIDRIEQGRREAAAHPESPPLDPIGRTDFAAGMASVGGEGSADDGEITWVSLLYLHPRPVGPILPQKPSCGAA